jgi:hypothetical protein
MPLNTTFNMGENCDASIVPRPHLRTSKQQRALPIAHASIVPRLFLRTGQARGSGHFKSVLRTLCNKNNGGWTDRK